MLHTFRNLNAFVLILKSLLIRGGKSTDIIRDQLDLKIVVEVTVRKISRRIHNTLQYFSLKSMEYIKYALFTFASLVYVQWNMVHGP